MIEGRRPTRVRLPLRPGVGAQTLIERLFRRFAYARVLLPALARQVREVVVEGGPSPGVHFFDGRPINGAPGWSVGGEIDLPDHPGRWRILRFRPADAGRDDMGTAALAIGLREGLPAAFDPEVPFLWNVTPTSEIWGCGYVVNGPFKLDPGRTHVSIDDDMTLRTVGGLGEALGKGLIGLHDVLVDPADESHDPLLVHDVRCFLSSLWRVLARGLNNSDALRRRFFRELHGNGRGLSAWIRACPVVPSGLPAPFQPMLPPLASHVRIEVASGDFDDDLCAVLAAIEDEDSTALVDGRCIVSAEVEQLLRPLCNFAGTEGNRIAPIPLRPSNLFAELAEGWEHYLTPERLHALRPIDGGGDSNFDAYDSRGVTWRHDLKAQAVDGSFQPLRSLLLRNVPELVDHADADGEDELLRAAFAPDDRVLDPAYIERSEDWRVFRWASGSPSRRRRNDGGVVRGSSRGPPPCGDPLPAARRRARSRPFCSVLSQLTGGRAGFKSTKTFADWWRTSARNLGGSHFWSLCFPRSSAWGVATGPGPTGLRHLLPTPIGMVG